MYVKVAYNLTDHHGYYFDKAETFYGVTIFSNIEKSGRFKDEKVLTIESRSGGGAYLYNPTFEIGPDSIMVKGYASVNLTEKAPEGVRAPVACVMQEWILKVNPQSDEEKDYEKAMKTAEAKEKKMWRPYGK